MAAPISSFEPLRYLPLVQSSAMLQQAMQKYAERFPDHLNILSEIQLANKDGVVARALEFFRDRKELAE